MSSIAKRANVAQGTFYIYFSSKQEMLIAIMRELLVDLGGIIRTLAERTDLPAPEVLRQAMDSCFTRMNKESRLIGVREGSMKVTHPRVAADFLWTPARRAAQIPAPGVSARDHKLAIARA